MSRLSDAMKNLKFDRRLVEINLSNGTLTKEELKKHFDQIPDSASNAIIIEMEETESQENETH